MKKKKVANLEKLQKEFNPEGNKLPIFRSSDTYANMRKERFTVPLQTAEYISKAYKLTQQRMSDAVNKLVDRTPHWLEMDEDEQKEEIRAILLLETVAYYLYDNNSIQSSCNMYENGFDENGNIILDAFYVKEKSPVTKEAVDSLFKKDMIKTEGNVIYPFVKKGES